DRGRRLTAESAWRGRVHRYHITCRPRNGPVTIEPAMKLTAQEMLRQLGAGVGIAQVCEAAAITRRDFDAWWKNECARRVPAATGQRQLTGLKANVRIERDKWGIAHVHADHERDLFLGFGYAVAQDRLFQLDYL